VPGQENIMLTSQPAYEKMKAAYEAQQEIPESGFFDSIFGSASAAEPPAIPNLTYRDITPTFDLGTGITNTTSATPFINTGQVYQNLQNTDLVNQLIQENQMKTNMFSRPNIMDISGGITSIPNNIVTPATSFQDFYSPVYEPYDPEKDDEQVDYLPGQSSFKDKISDFAQNIMGQPGISSLIGFVNPVAGLISRGLGYLGRNLSPSFVGPKGARGYGSESVGGLFARSNTLADFVRNVRDKRARDEAAARGAAKQESIAKMNAFRAIRDSQPSGGGGGGGIGSSYGGAASPGSQGRGGSDEMGSF
jgi:hypothetical protein